MGGIIQKINKRYDKKNRQWAIIELHGNIGKADVFVFSNVFEKYNNLLIEDGCLFIIGAPSNRDEEDDSLKLIADKIYPLSNIRRALSQSINILITPNHTMEDVLDQLKLLSKENIGRCSLVLHLQSENGGIQKIKSNQIRVNSNIEFMKDLRGLFGNKNVWIG